MKERPILFSAPMVRALLDGSKTQTRRICKSQPYGNGFAFAGGDYLCHNDYLPPSAMLMDVRSGKHSYTTSNMEGWESECPYGQPSDRLWVREAWGYFDPDGSGEDYDRDHNEEGKAGPCSAYRSDMLQEGSPLRDYWRRRIAYRATFADQKYGMGPVGPSRWRPSIHMARWASRITLEIVSVRVERLQDISEADARAEGCSASGWTPSYSNPDNSGMDTGKSAAEDYAELWEQINGPGSWAANPWVWVVSFSRVQP